MSFPNWRTVLLAHPTETAVDRNTVEFLTEFGIGLSATDRSAALILACSPGKSTALCLYHNFVNFGGSRTGTEAKFAVLEGLGPLASTFLLPVPALDSASC